MKSPTVILTLDYEISGDGKGDVMKSLIKPTDRLLDILNDRNIKMTVFFEIEEYIVFKKHADVIEKNIGYNPAEVIEKQLKKMVLAGHDIGLHIHPQWIGAHYDGKNFILYPENHCLFDVYKTENEMISYIGDRLNRLVTLLNKYNPSARINCFRAGGLALRPEKLTLSALRSLDIKADSSVVKGLHRQGNGVNLDFRKAPYNKGFWNVTDNICAPDQHGKFIEFPIYSQLKREYKKLTFNRIRRKFFSSGHPIYSVTKGTSEMAIPRTPWGILGYLLKKSPVKYDFCHMTSKEMIAYVNDAIKEKTIKPKYPLTMIGHSKEFYNDKHFSSFLDSVTKTNKVKFKTMSEVLKLIENERQESQVSLNEYHTPANFIQDIKAVEI